LLLSCGVVDEALTTESGDLASLMSGVDHLPIGLRALLQRCHTVVGWLKDHDGSVQATLKPLGIHRILLETPTPHAGVHQSARFLDVLKEECTSHAQSGRLVVPEKGRQAGSYALRAIGVQAGQEFVLCHPGSGSVHKCVQPEVFVGVVRGFQERGILPVLVGGPADGTAIERIRALGVKDVPAVQNQSLATLAGILAQARLFVGHDSGVTHLAAALQIPTVAIFGPTDPLQWAPQGECVSVVTGVPCSCHGWEQVRACEEKFCLAVRPEDILAASFFALSRYPTVTKS